MSDFADAYRRAKAATAAPAPDPLDLGAARDLLAGLRDAAIRGDLSDTTLRWFLMTAADEILRNLDAGRTPRADAAFLLARPQHRPPSTDQRDAEIVVAAVEAKLRGDKRESYLREIAARYCLSVETVRGIARKEGRTIARIVRLAAEGKLSG